VGSDVLEVGDVMRWDAELVKDLQAGGVDVLVRVSKIERQDDDTVKLWLETTGARSEIRQ
jgi:hypothetical protein